MPRKCSVPGCNSNHNKYFQAGGKYITNFGFPKQPKLRKKWIEAINREESFEPTIGSAICAKHFDTSQIIRIDSVLESDGSISEYKRKFPKLAPNAIPTIFPKRIFKSSEIELVERDLDNNFKELIPVAKVLDMSSKTYKWCIVSQCTNTTQKTPEKLFVQVPRAIKQRKKWLQLAGRDPHTFSFKTSVYLCQDHFDIENDMENYMEYRLMGSIRKIKIRMKPGVMPTKFDCQTNSSYQTPSSTFALVNESLSKIITPATTIEQKSETNTYKLPTNSPIGTAEPESILIQINVPRNNNGDNEQSVQKFLVKFVKTSSKPSTEIKSEQLSESEIEDEESLLDGVSDKEMSIEGESLNTTADEEVDPLREEPSIKVKLEDARENAVCMETIPLSDNSKSILPIAVVGAPIDKEINIKEECLDGSDNENFDSLREANNEQILVKDEIEDDIDIKKELEDYRDNDGFLKNELETIDRCCSPNSESTLTASTLSASETAMLEDRSFSELDDIYNPPDGSTSSAILEDENSLEMQQLDQPEYIHIKKVSRSEFAEIAKEYKQQQKEVTEGSQNSGRKSTKTEKIPLERHVKRGRKKKPPVQSIIDPSTLYENNVTNFTDEGDYINDHDYLLGPYKRNNMFKNPLRCWCLLCNSSQMPHQHLSHMLQRHRTYRNTHCRICKIDFRSLFSLNLHVREHLYYCSECKKKVSYNKYEKHAKIHRKLNRSHLIRNATQKVIGIIEEATDGKKADGEENPNVPDNMVFLSMAGVFDAPPDTNMSENDSATDSSLLNHVGLSESISRSPNSQVDMPKDKILAWMSDGSSNLSSGLGLCDSKEKSVEKNHKLVSECSNKHPEFSENAQDKTPAAKRLRELSPHLKNPIKKLSKNKRKSHKL